MPCDKLTRLRNPRANGLRHSELPSLKLQLLGHENRLRMMPPVEVLVPANQFFSLRLATNNIDTYLDAACATSELCGDVYLAVEGVRAR